MMLLAVAFAVGVVVGFSVRVGVLRAVIRRARKLKDQLDNSEARHDAYRIADTKADLDLVSTIRDSDLEVPGFVNDNGRIRL